MKNTSRIKKPARKVPPLALPAGVTVYQGPTKGLKRWFGRPEIECSGGCRTTRAQPVGHRSGR